METEKPNNKPVESNHEDESTTSAVVREGSMSVREGKAVVGKTKNGKPLVVVGKSPSRSSSPSKSK